VTAQPLACPRCDSPVEAEDLRCPICSQACPATRPADAPETRVEVLRCDGCGAAVAYDARSRSPRCAFCGSAVRLEAPEDPLEQTEALLPFTVTPAFATEAFRRWIGSLGFFRPSDLRSASQLESIRPLWWVAWVVDGEAEVSWTADSDHGAPRADWAPHAGRTTMRFDAVVVPATRGLSPDEAGRLAGSYDLSGAMPEIDAPPPGAVTEHFDVQRSFARRHVLDAIDGLASRRVQADHVPGRRFRNLHTSMLLRRLATRRVALPAYVLAYRYRDRLYRLVLSGQDGTCLLGSAPWSIAKIVTVVGLGVAAAAILLLGILALAV
jgi:hypothetical protein